MLAPWAISGVRIASEMSSRAPSSATSFTRTPSPGSRSKERALFATRPRARSPRRCAVAPRDALALRDERHGAVHRAGVDEDVSERVGEAARDGALAGSGGSVDRDDGAHASHGRDLPRTGRAVSLEKTASSAGRRPPAHVTRRRCGRRAREAYRRSAGSSRRCSRSRRSCSGLDRPARGRRPSSRCDASPRLSMRAGSSGASLPSITRPSGSSSHVTPNARSTPAIVAMRVALLHAELLGVADRRRPRCTRARARTRSGSRRWRAGRPRRRSIVPRRA